MEESSAEGILPSLFEPCDVHVKENLWSVLDIQKELAKHLKISDVSNLKALANSIKALRWPKGANNGIRGFYLRLRNDEAKK